MIKLKFVLAFLLGCSMAFSQTTELENEKRLKTGFNLGLNYSNLISKENLPENASAVNGFGFRLGLLADYKVSEIFYISPKGELSFNSSEVHFNIVDGSQPDYKVMPISLEFMTHFTFKDINAKLSSYFYIGPNVKIPLTAEEDSRHYATGKDFAIDFGIGLDKALAHFHFAPELRYSIGLLNINQHPSIQTLNFHNISLIFNILE